jgi:hypothetical protein
LYAGIRAILPQSNLCSDGSISQVGFMVEADAWTFTSEVATASLAMTETGLASQIAVVRQREGFAYPCDWLQLGLFDGNPAAWLAGEDRGSLYIPEAERTASIDLTPTEGLRTTFDFVGLKGDRKGEVSQTRVTNRSQRSRDPNPGELHHLRQSESNFKT